MDLGDGITVALAREFVKEVHGSTVRTIAITTVSSLVAALAARKLGAPHLAIASGFTTLDADPHPSLSLMESSLGAATSPRGPIGDTFVAVARGLVGVVVVPAQLDGRGATNLSHIGGTHDQPKVALPGSRGLPDNNDSPAAVWYLVPDHSRRQLVPEVDFASGPPPSPGRNRTLVSNLGLFRLEPGRGWRASAIFPGVSVESIEASTGYPIDVAPDVTEIPPPSEREHQVLEAVDPQGLRHIEFLGRDGSARAAELIKEERMDHQSRR